MTRPNRKAGIIGFSEDQAKEIRSMVEKSKLGLEIGPVIIPQESAPFELKIDEELELIILGSIGFSTSVPEVIQKIRSVYPRTQVVVVFFSKQFDLSINAFRAGARDILTWPLNETELMVSLQRALTYQIFYQRPESMIDILTLLNTFSDWRKFDSEDKLFNEIKSFLKAKMGQSSFVVLAVPASTSTLNFTKRNFQIYYGADVYEQNFVPEDLALLFQDHKLRTLEKGFYPFFMQKSDQGHTILINLGVHSQVRYLGLLRPEGLQEDTFLGEFIGHFSRLIQNATDFVFKSKVQSELVSLAHTDDVTGLFNQRKLYQDLDKSIKHYEETKEPFTVIFIDIDRFKQVNDGHGHLTGSLLLVQLAKELKKVLRETDYIYRYGGDEFVVIVPNATMDQAKIIGERILNTVKKKSFYSTDKKAFTLSLSIGVANFPEHARTKDEILAIADDMMYVAKEGGRGQVCLATERVLTKRKKAL